MARVLINKNCRVAPDGIHIETYFKGTTVDVPEHVAEIIETQLKAGEILPEEKLKKVVKEEKAVEEAPVNKAVQPPTNKGMSKKKK